MTTVDRLLWWRFMLGCVTFVFFRLLTRVWIDRRAVVPSVRLRFGGSVAAWGENGTIATASLPVRGICIFISVHFCFVSVELRCRLFSPVERMTHLPGDPIAQRPDRGAPSDGYSSRRLPAFTLTRGCWPGMRMSIDS